MRNTSREGLTMTRYTIGDETGDTTDVDCESLAEALDLAESWVRDLDWGAEGGEAMAYVDDPDGHRHQRRVTISPDERALVLAAGGDADCRHVWSSEGHGGVDENPGCWSGGGTTMIFASHCTNCGISRREVRRGSQRNPGERDTVEFFLPGKDEED